jgi:Carboxypeptidase regulatory-like domain
MLSRKSSLSLNFYRSWIAALVLAAMAVAGFSGSAFAQATLSTGSIQGLVTDPSGAVVPGAKVVITNQGTGQALSITTNSSGLYNSGAIVPGEYKVRVEYKGFRTSELPITVQVGAISTGNLKLEVGEASQVVEVQGSEVQVNTEQATVQGVVTPAQIENLPINGRNFLDLAQLEPGIQVQDGAGFDPTKNGFESISIGGRAGRTARIMVDGVDVSDENVGTTTQGVPASAIQEFSIAQSSLDLSSSLTSSGTVGVTTKSGSNSLHGEGFYGFRDQRVGFTALPGGVSPPFQRNQMGGDVGGAIIKDKLFFFGDVERTKQDFGNAVTFSAPFTDLSGVYSTPYRDNEYVGRLDWSVRQNMHLFYKFGYDNNSILKPANNYSPFLNRDNTPSHTVGLDFTSGSFTHSIRYGYNYFNNSLGAAPAGGGIIDPDPNLFMISNAGGLLTGPNVNAPQGTIQANHQIRYDGSKQWKNHIFRFGGAFDKISIGGFAAFGAFGAEVIYSANGAPTGSAPALVSGGSPADNPLNYPISSVTLFNGQGAFSEKTAFGKKNYSGFFDNRIEFYAGDAWKVRPNLTVNYGVHYVLDTNRNNNDLNNNPDLANALNQFGAGLGNKTNAPKTDFSPEVGIAWSPGGGGKTVFRAGAGLYYENTPLNDILFDRVSRLPTGLFFGSTGFCGSTFSVKFPGIAQPVTSSDGIPLSSICGSPASATINGVTVGTAIADLQTAYQNATVTAGPGANGSYVPNLGGTIGNPASTLAPNYVTPRSFQWNAGFQHQIARGTVLSVDYVHNMGTHFLLGVDANHVGAARNLNVANAVGAINTTLVGTGCAPATGPGASSQAAVNCYLAANPTATIANFAANGLDASGTLPNPAAAFPGSNPAVGFGEVFYPIGDSRYDALQMSVRSNVEHPFRGVSQMNLVVSYAYSRLDSNYPYTVNPGSQVSGDQDFLNPAVDWDHPNRYFGPAAQDRTHQLSFGPIFQLAHRGPLVSFIGHIDSPLPLTLVLPQVGGGGTPGEIFRTDVTGDGTVGYPAGEGGDIVPGSNVGSFGRSISPSGLNGFINNYNSKSANQLTPAGQALVTANVFTQSQLSALGAVTPTIADAPPGNVGMGWLRSVDFRFAWPIKLRERFTIEPSVTAFNILNFANFDSSVNSLSGILQASPGTSVNNVTGFSTNCPSGTCRGGDRLGPGSGTFALGAPRQIEFGLKVAF